MELLIMHPFRTSRAKIIWTMGHGTAVASLVERWHKKIRFLPSGCLDTREANQWKCCIFRMKKNLRPCSLSRLCRMAPIGSKQNNAHQSLRDIRWWMARRRQQPCENGQIHDVPCMLCICILLDILLNFLTRHCTFAQGHWINKTKAAADEWKQSPKRLDL